MKVLITTKKYPPSRFLVYLATKELINEVRGLVSDRKHAQAMFMSFAKGNFEGEISEKDLPHVAADLILSEDSASWDLVK